MGPLAYRAHFDRVMGYVEVGKGEGAELLTGGGRPDDLDRGFYLAPTIFSNVTPDMRIAREEIFGPVLSVLKWSDVDDAIRIANDTDMGLTANIWTNDISLAHRTAARIEAGYVWINGSGARPTGAPFGGYKQSGIGRETGVEELVSFTQTKNVNLVYPR
jgi:acyl-CoA reductase-like NAD-dependent aldehyde dehydrogenase